jgi:hypothetical protein
MEAENFELISGFGRGYGDGRGFGYGFGYGYGDGYGDDDGLSSGSGLVIRFQFGIVWVVKN